jgi:hypothetical protein
MVCNRVKPSQGWSRVGGSRKKAAPIGGGGLARVHSQSEDEDEDENEEEDGTLIDGGVGIL